MSDFITLGIRSVLAEELQKSGIVAPTPVQMQVIPALLGGRDIIAQSQTGTGKTLAFLLPILEKIDPAKTHVQALIITPTRELALQITTEAAKLAGLLNIQVLSVYGGQDVDRQIKKLKGHPHIIIGTPGRLLDHLQRKTIYLSGVSMLVLDEADQMLHMGFLDDVEELVQKTSVKRQTLLFSATIPAKIRSLATRYMKKPVDVRIQSQNITLDEIRQVAVLTPEEDKLAALCHMIDEYHPYLAIVFCHTKQRAVEINTALIQRGYAADELHGDLSQAKRERVIRRFSEAKLQILVATDIAARGLDIEGITHIFNYDISHDTDSHVHRIGRTGRAGQTGLAVTLVTSQEQHYLRMIEQGIGRTLEKYRFTRQQLVPATKKAAVAADKSTAAPAAKPPAKKTASHGGNNLRSRRKPKPADTTTAIAEKRPPKPRAKR